MLPALQLFAFVSSLNLSLPRPPLAPEFLFNSPSLWNIGATVADLRHLLHLVSSLPSPSVLGRRWELASSWRPLGEIEVPPTSWVSWAPVSLETPTLAALGHCSLQPCSPGRFGFFGLLQGIVEDFAFIFLASRLKASMPPPPNM